MNAREVGWSLDETTVDGTLVVPSGPGPFPGLVMVAGSGPTDRDWNTPLLPGSNGSARLIADALASAGIASLRYDKRATGPRVRENMKALFGKMSMASHLDELVGAVETLVREAPVRRDRVFVLGNSEGTLHALNYQRSRPAIPLAGLVLTAPPGRAVGTVARSQIAAQFSVLPNAAELMGFYDEGIARFMAGQPVNANPALPAGAQQLLQGLEAPVNLPFARELWLADAADLLPDTPGPILVLIGKKDLQVDWQADGQALQQAARGRSDVTFLFPEDANHVLKHEATPRGELVIPQAVARYNTDDAHLDEEGLTGILDWLAARIGAPKP